jgi:hypothetical protein
MLEKHSYNLKALESSTVKRLLFINQSIRDLRKKLKPEDSYKLRMKCLKNKRKEVDQLLSAIKVAITKDEWERYGELKHRYIETSA